MPWIQLSFRCGKDQSSTISDLLSNIGAVSVTFQDAEDQPLLEPGVGETPLWNQVIVTGLFDGTNSVDSLIARIQELMGSDALPSWQATALEDKAWEREWMQHFQPMRFGTRTWICPSWCQPPEPNAVNIFLDPGLAFGTGTHPTTALCLEWLDQHIKGGEIVIDFGCGSGILGIGALKLGASKVWAVDNDPQALVATRDNAMKNKANANLTVLGVNEPLPVKADILLANILANPLISLASSFAGNVNPGGVAILSGILSEQQDSIIEAYATGFKLMSSAQIEDWVRLDLQRI